MVDFTVGALATDEAFRWRDVAIAHVELPSQVFAFADIADGPVHKQRVNSAQSLWDINVKSAKWAITMFVQWDSAEVCVPLLGAILSDNSCTVALRDESCDKAEIAPLQPDL
jgi:hypothetical protein